MAKIKVKLTDDELNQIINTLYGAKFFVISKKDYKSYNDLIDKLENVLLLNCGTENPKFISQRID